MSMHNRRRVSCFVRLHMMDAFSRDALGIRGSPGPHQGAPVVFGYTYAVVYS
jgi:hypothetical protein